tara:strand:+ start:434 stop:664 length:231 start_codon:yes stop_codon:yes gene_type:complete
MIRDIEFYFMNKEKDPASNIVFKFINESGRVCINKNTGEEIYAYTKSWAACVKDSLSISLKENIKIIKGKKQNGKS